MGIKESKGNNAHVYTFVKYISYIICLLSKFFVR